MSLTAFENQRQHWIINSCRVYLDIDIKRQIWTLTSKKLIFDITERKMIDRRQFSIVIIAFRLFLACYAAISTGKSSVLMPFTLHFCNRYPWISFLTALLSLWKIYWIFTQCDTPFCTLFGILRLLSFLTENVSRVRSGVTCQNSLFCVFKNYIFDTWKLLKITNEHFQSLCN